MSDTLNIDKTENVIDNKKIYFDKRKRINRIKITLIIVMLFLILIPTILCIMLGIRMSNLEKKLEVLSYNLGVEDQTDYIKNDNNYAYASDGLGDVISIDDINNNNDNIDKEDISEEDINDQVIDNDTNNNKGTYDPNSDINSDPNGDTNSDSNNDIDGVPNSDTNSGPNNDINNNPNSNTNGHPNSNMSDVNSEDIGNIPSTTDDEDKKDLIYNGKKVYLTFDDGPSYITDDVLDVLAEYGVKATFFVVGHTDQKSKDRYKRIVDEGHTLGIHSYSHKYSEIYNSVEDFDKDFTKLGELLYDITGYTPTIYRFPGGSLNQVNSYGMEAFIRYLNEKKITYYDWNVVNGDATGVEYTEEQMIDNVLNGVKVKNNSIVLMHDGSGKEKTLATLPNLLEALISGGADVMPLDETVPTIQQIKATSVE